LKTNGIVCQTKEGRAWTFKVPANENDLHFQIFFKAPWVQLASDKRLFRLIEKIKERLEKEDRLSGEYKIELIHDAESVYIFKEGFWKDFTVNGDLLVKLIEDSCEEVI